MPSNRLHLAVIVFLVLVSVANGAPVPDDGEVADEPETSLRPSKIPKVTPKDLGVSQEEDDDSYDDYEEDEVDYMTWEDLGRMIYSWAKLFAEPQQLKPMKKCLTGNAPRDAVQLIKRVESCVRIIDPEFSLRKIASIFFGE